MNDEILDNNNVYGKYNQLCLSAQFGRINTMNIYLR